MNEEVSVCWFRRDLRLQDNAALFHALESGMPVMCFFIFDSNILSQLEDKTDSRIVFIQRQLSRLNEELKKQGSALIVKSGYPLEAWNELLTEYNVVRVFANRDYEPYAVSRDDEISGFLNSKKCSFHTFKDHVIFEKDDIVKDDGKPYTVYTPYLKKWRNRFDANSQFLDAYQTEKYFSRLKRLKPKRLIQLNEIGFNEADIHFPLLKVDENILKQYADARNFPAIEGTTRLGVHLRFGTVSIREVVREAWKTSETWVNELIWKEFFIQVLWHFPHVTDHSFKKEYDLLKWRHDEKGFQNWSNGTTGYPIVDAGMRELNQTGFMHNRVRMLAACLLTKYLLIDWRWGEAYFAKKLLDYELASNNGNWQWSAGTGCDAAPYFRIFNMDAQMKKFDPDFVYVKKWVPEFNSPYYHKPIVEYEFARKRCLAFFKKGLERNSQFINLA